MAHREPITHITDAPHGSEESHLQEQMRTEASIKVMKVWKEHEAHGNRQQYPGKDSGYGPGSFPGPLLNLPNRRIEGCGKGRANDVPSDSREDCHDSFSCSIEEFGRAARPSDEWLPGQAVVYGHRWRLTVQPDCRSWSFRAGRIRPAGRCAAR